MRVLCLSTLFALFLRGRSFSHCRTFQKVQLPIRLGNAGCRNAQHVSKRSSLSMHMGHSHSHDHHDDDDHEHDKLNRSGPELSLSLWGQLMRPKEMLLHRPQGKVFLAALLVMIPALIRKRFCKLDFGIFAVTAVVLSVFDSARFAVKKYMSKIKMFQESLVKHSTPLTRKYFFKNENAADRITLAGVYINIILSFAKFFGGIGEAREIALRMRNEQTWTLIYVITAPHISVCNIARLPADDDHPYGHGKFESVGSLFLSLTLLATGLSVGAWSYDKMHEVLIAQQFATKGLRAVVQVPSWPALALAAFSIASKEWLFQITKKVGDALNSQILVANAWHHRSDAFSSVLSLISIAAAMSIPGLLIADSAAGMLVAGMICLTGFEILFESVKQLTDTSDKSLAIKIENISTDVPGVLGVTQIRARTIGSGSLVDLTVLIDEKLSATAAHSIGERARWQIMDSLPQVSDVLVRTRSTETVCPLLSKMQRDPILAEKEIRRLLDQHQEVLEIRRVVVHFKQVAYLAAEIVIKVDEALSVKASKELATRLQEEIKKQIDVIQVEIHLDLGTEDLDSKQEVPGTYSYPPFNTRGLDLSQVKLAGI